MVEGWLLHQMKLYKLDSSIDVKYTQEQIDIIIIRTEYDYLV